MHMNMEAVKQKKIKQIGDNKKYKNHSQNKLLFLD